MENQEKVSQLVHMVEPTKISVNLGYTANLGNFESLRVDLGIVDFKRENETLDEGVDRVYNYVMNKLSEKVDETKGAVKE